jgi:two-component system response regulator NreC
MTINIGIAEDQAIFRKGLVLLLNGFDNMTVQFEASNGQELLEKMAKSCPDVVILDFKMHYLNGLETCRIIRKLYPDVKVIILSIYDEHEFVETAIQNGANAYLAKDDEIEDLQNAISSVLTNNFYFNERVSKVFINQLMNKGYINPKFTTNKAVFTPTELQILDYMCKEYTAQMIADAMHKSLRTIEKYKSEMLEKVGVKNSIGLIMYAIKNHLIKY